MKTCVELREERAALVHEARKTLTDAEAREGGATEADYQAFDRAMDDAEKIRARYERMERLESAEADLDRPSERRSRPIDEEAREREGQRREGEKAESKGKKRAAYRHWLRTGAVLPELRDEAVRGNELRELEMRALAEMEPELRDTIIGTASKGGYLITPVEISRDIAAVIKDYVFIRQLCEAAGSVTTVTSAQKLGVRKMTSHMADANWTTEVAAVTEDTTMAFDRRDLEPQLCSKLAKASIRTLMLSTDAENIIRDELGYKFGITEEKAFISGTGSGQPLGVFTADPTGISTARDVTAASSTAVVGDDLINAKYSLKAPYRKDKSCAWIVSRTLVSRVRKLKVSSTVGAAGDQQYVWQPGLTEGAPDRILDIPYEESEYAPNTFTTGLYVALLGCFRFYRIAQLGDAGTASLSIQRLTELYAGTNEVGFIGRRWVDGAPVLEEAFARLKLA